MFAKFVLSTLYKGIYKYPGFVDTALLNDVAIVKLAKSLKESKQIKIARFPKANETLNKGSELNNITA
jgi:hypothetical protein